MNKGRQVGDLPQFIECGFCLLPRFEGLAACPFCGSVNISRRIKNVPEDFALRLLAEGRWDAALEYLEGEIAGGRETSRYALLVGWLSLMNKDLRAVETWCHESLRLQAADAGPHVLLGVVFEQAGRWEEAVAEYTLAESREPDAARRRVVAERKLYCQSQIPEW